jgi:hypothetical protein
MRTLPLILLVLFAQGYRPVFSGISRYDIIEVSTSLGPLQMWQTSEWIGLDTTIVPTDCAPKAFDEFDTSADWFSGIDYCFIPYPCTLLREHPAYFVTVYPEEVTEFKVLYDDKYDNQPAAGYPRLTYWSDAAPQRIILPLEFREYRGPRMLYGKKVALPPGTYRYQYSVKNDQFPDEFILSASSFVVTPRPQQPGNPGLPESSHVSTSRVDLAWDSTGGEYAGTSYRLFAGKDPARLSLAYEGEHPRCQLTELEYSTRYFWQIEAVNPYGITSRSPLYSFTTIQAPAHAFNYPNPFSPVSGQPTRIVFDMSANGSADIAVYTEFGDLCWSGSFANLLKGANEIAFAGRDDGGRALYNGTYICMITKKYSDREETDKCRILVLK